jgi:hypothetical protein
MTTRLRNVLGISKTLVIAGFMAVSGSAISSDKTMMQKAMHTSPMPSLMMLISNNADLLELDNDQLETVRSWRMENMSKSKMLIKEILDLEAEIKDNVLIDLSQQEITELKEDLMEARGNLIDLKYKCISTMKSALDEDQWKKLMELRETNMRIMTDKAGGNEIQAFLRVSPMPKFMAVVLMHGHEIGMTAEQKEALEGWRLKNMNHWAMLFDQVLKEEEAITDSALEMGDNKELMDRFATINEKRREMAQMSLDCRDNMRKVLDDDQWKIVVEKFQQYRKAR